MTDEKEKLTRLEWIVDAHSQSILYLQNTQDTMKDSLDRINDTLTQIKWFSIGAVCVIMSHELGLIDFIKTVL